VSRAAAVALLLAAWLGAGLLFAAVVAPAAFAVLPSRTLAGALVGRVLPVIFVAGIVVALAGLLLDRSDVGRLPGLRRAALVAVAVACAVAQFAVGPRIERVRQEIDGPVEQLPPGDPRRAAFGRLHAASVAWLGLAMIGAATTLILVSLPARPIARAVAEPLVPARS
jgi:hypothetical protein